MSGPLQPQRQMCGMAHVAPTCGPQLGGAGWTTVHVWARFQLVCFSTCMHHGNSGLRDKASFERHIGHAVVGSDKGMGAPKASDSSTLPQES